MGLSFCSLSVYYFFWIGWCILAFPSVWYICRFYDSPRRKNWLWIVSWFMLCFAFGWFLLIFFLSLDYRVDCGFPPFDGEVLSFGHLQHEGGGWLPCVWPLRDCNRSGYGYEGGS